VIQYRRLAGLLLGVWLGAGIFADVAVTQNFQTVDRFLTQPGSIRTSAELSRLGRAEVREILRRNAGEENNVIFENWERFELIVGGVLFAVLLFGARPQKVMLGATLLMLLIVCVQHFYLSPEVTELGRQLADLPPNLAANDPLNTKFRTFHGIYSGAEILKLVVGFAFAARIVFRRKAAPDHFAKEFEAKTTVGSVK